jgi:hypothetical protein
MSTVSDKTKPHSMSCSELDYGIVDSKLSATMLLWQIDALRYVNPVHTHGMLQRGSIFQHGDRGVGSDHPRMCRVI